MRQRDDGVVVWQWHQLDRMQTLCTYKIVYISVADVPAESALHALHLVTLSCHRHVDESTTGLSLLPHREHGAGCRHSWSCCSRPLLFVINWKHFCCPILPTNAGKQTGHCFVMRRRSSVGGAIRVTQLLFTVYMCACCADSIVDWCGLFIMAAVRCLSTVAPVLEELAFSSPSTLLSRWLNMISRFISRCNSL